MRDRLVTRHALRVVYVKMAPFVIWLGVLAIIIILASHQLADPGLKGVTYSVGLATGTIYFALATKCMELVIASIIAYKRYEEMSAAHTSSYGIHFVQQVEQQHEISKELRVGLVRFSVERLVIVGWALMLIQWCFFVSRMQQT